MSGPQRRQLEMASEQAALQSDQDKTERAIQGYDFLQSGLVPPELAEQALAIGAPSLNAVPGVRKSVAEAASGMTSPVNLAMLTGGGAASQIPRIGGAVMRGIAGGFAADIATHMPELGTAAGEASVTGTPEEQQKAFTDIGISATMGGLAGAGTFARGPSIPSEIKRTVERGVDAGLNKSAAAALKAADKPPIIESVSEVPNVIKETSVPEPGREAIPATPPRSEQPAPAVQVGEARGPDAGVGVSKTATAEQVAAFTADQMREFSDGLRKSGRTPTDESFALGRTITTPEQLAQLKAHEAAAKAEFDAALAAENSEALSPLSSKKQFFTEAIEEAVGASPFKGEDGQKFAEKMAEGKLANAPEAPAAEAVKPEPPKAAELTPDVIETTPLDPQSGAPIEAVTPKPSESINTGALQEVGMGAMKAGELDPPKPFKTSNKNATVDAERKERGLPPMMDLERRTNQSAWDEAMRRIDERPESQDALIAELAEQPRALTPEENAMVTHRRIDLRNEYEKALHRWKKAFESDDMALAAEESQRVKDWSSKLSDLEDVTKATGAESGRSLQARKMMANEDFTLAAMELRAMEAKGGPLSAQEHIELIKAQEKITDLQRKIDALEAGREGKEVETQAAETMKDVEREAKTKRDPKAASEETITGRIKAKFEKGEQAAITPLVQQLARMLWERGVRTQKGMIDGLHDILKTIDPEFTRDQTQRAFSGYGDFRALSKTEIDVGLRDLKGQTQQVLKIEALEARKPLEKTGVERRTPSDEERRLIKQVNELKRKYGVVVTDPATQLKSALQSRKTYYEHRIADLKHEIATRERIVKTKSPSPRDAELDLMIAEKDRLQAEHDSIFPKAEITDAQRLQQAIAAAERSLAQWEVRLTNAEKGVFDSREPGRKVTSPELESIRAEAAAIREHVKELHDLDAAVVEQKRAASLESQKATLEKDIAEQERKLREGDLKAAGQRQNRPADPLLEELMQKRDDLNKQLAEARKKPADQKYAESQQRQLDKLNKSIAEREAKVAAGDLSPSGTPRINRPLPPELEQAKQRLEAVNKQISDMRKAATAKTPEQIALQSLKTRMATQTVQFRKRLAEKDFAKRERKPVVLDAEANKLKAELDAAKQDFQTGLEQDRWARMSVFDKTKRKIGDVYDAARALMTTGEFSFILRQGKLATLSHPIRTAKALPDMFRALLASDVKAREIDAAVHNHPDAPAARTAKLHLVDEGVSMHKAEEILMGRWVGKIPVVKNFNHAAQVFLNRVRFDMWQGMRKSLSKSGEPTLLEDKQIAMFVNESTGRGGMGKVEPAAVALGRVFFSPRYAVSRWQLAAGHSLWGGTMRTRRIIATEYARSIMGLGLYYTALQMLFSDGEEKGTVELDPRSTDFGKVKIGDTRLDPLAGLSQAIVYASRTGAGEKKTMSGKVVPIRGEDVKFGGDKWSDITARYIRGKLHPVPAAVANLFDGTDLGGDEATVINQTQNMVAPITYVDIYTALREQDLDDGTALALLALLGEGLQTYEKKEKSEPKP